MPILQWLDKDKHIQAHKNIPYRILNPDSTLSHGDNATDNMIIQGDNLDALKSLLPYYAGQVKCIFIDPPYNTRKDFDHYSDNLEHSQWLEMIYPRLVLLRELLAEDGSIWITLDDDEGHYLKVIMDEIFGRGNFISNVIWQKKHTRANDARFFSDNHDHIIAYSKNKDIWKINLLERTNDQIKGYTNPDNDYRGVWASGPCHVKTPNEKDIYPVTTPKGTVYMPPAGTSWRFSQEKMHQLVVDNRIYFGKNNDSVPRYKRFLSDVQQGIVPVTIWLHQEVGHNQDAKKEVKAFNTNDVFATPKPEKLIHRILHLATNKNDLVLDSFLGSGTTCAVAHKMRRRYIGIEMGDHAVTHCAPRMQAVIAGEQGGISKDINWTGGGGFQFYTLGDAIFTANGKINPEIRFTTLAQHIWFYETKTALTNPPTDPLLGINNNTTYVLLYNGILGDKRPTGGNVLTRATMQMIKDSLPKDFTGSILVYGESCRLSPKTLEQNKLTFKQTPYDVKV